MNSELKITLDIWSVILLFSALLGVFLALVFLTQRKGKPANYLLGVLQVIIVLLISEYLLFNSGIYKSLHIPLFIFTPLIFLVGPVYYFYSTILLGRRQKIQLKDLLHLIPFILCFINYFDYYLTLILFYFGNRQAEFDFILNFNGFHYMGFEIFQTGIYVYVVNRMLTQTEKNLKNIRSGIEPLKINWLKKLNLIFIVYLVLKVCSLYFLMQIEYLLEVEYVLTLALSVIIYFIGYSSINLHEMFVNEIPVNEHPKYEKSALTKDQVLELSKSIKKLMETEKPYLRQELKLSDLAALLSVSTNHLSQLLNKELKTNFYDFINEYRVNEAKKQLNGQRKLNQTILSIAFESGFSNKASFNRIFKKHTGTTPTNYSKSILSISGN